MQLVACKVYPCKNIFKKSVKKSAMSKNLICQKICDVNVAKRLLAGRYEILKKWNLNCGGQTRNLSSPSWSRLCRNLRHHKKIVTPLTDSNSCNFIKINRFIFDIKIDFVHSRWTSSRKTLPVTVNWWWFKSLLSLLSRGRFSQKASKMSTNWS